MKLKSASMFACAALCVGLAQGTGPAEAQARAAERRPGPASAAAAVRQLTGAAERRMLRAAFEITDRDAALAELLAAEADANEALRRDIGDYGALLVKGQILGYRALLQHSKSTAIQARDLLESLTIREPGRPEAYGSLAVWNGEAVSQLGAMLAAATVDASKKSVRRNFEAAMERDPSNPVYPAYYGLLTLRLNGRVETARQMFDRAAALEARTPAERLFRDQATTMLRVLDTRTPREAKKVAETLAPFGRL